MRQSVQDNFVSFSQPFEGILDFMYLDVLGKVTTGMGNLIDTIGEAQQLPWFFAGDPNHLATAAEIAADWQGVKARQDLKLRGGGVFRTVAQLRISRATIDDLIARKLASNETTLITGTPEFANFASWPADAQLGLLSMAWAMGAAFAQGGRFPSFRAACAAQDFDGAANESKMREEGNPGLAPRNRADKILFTNAARVREGAAPDPSLDTLWYPRILTPGVPPVQGPQPGAGSWPILRLGDSAPLVTALQHLLNEHGAGLFVVGNFDAVTDTAVKSFQSANALTADGVVGQLTWQKLIVPRSFGDAGDAVSAIQDRLNLWDLGLIFLVPGEFDADTDNAVRAFQAAFGLTVDGKVGPGTWKALVSF